MIRPNRLKTETARNNAYPLRDGCEKTKTVPVGRGQSSTERYKRSQLAACGWERTTRTVAILGFFAHITWQASGLKEGEAVAISKSVGNAIKLHRIRSNLCQQCRNTAVFPHGRCDLKFNLRVRRTQHCCQLR